ncbi:hypothetical protein C1645_866257 [Glomus cerebriforme]|uniref:Uncharacterized protein n=1 Tax=Glomus cerebriforme TaxID=658196 RepID=A0A397TC68_9GLOM|nr:hypothetical protein C1645_866257 [Glomus cerebriforme]
MKIPIYHFFIVIYIILSENGALALLNYGLYTCKNVTESCYRLNELLAPCFYKIDFNEVFILESAGLDTLPFPKCMCNQDSYISLVSCCISCDIPVDNSLKFESDCRIYNHPVNIDEGKVPDIPNPSNLPDSPTTSSNTSKNTKSNLNLGMIAGLIISVIIVIGAIIVIIKYKKDKRHPPPLTSQPSMVFNPNIQHYTPPSQPPIVFNTPPPPPPRTSQPPTTQNSNQGQEFIPDYNSQQSFENRSNVPNPGITSDELSTYF